MGKNSNQSSNDENSSRPSLAELAKRVTELRDQATPRSDGENDDQAAVNGTSAEASEFIFPADEKPDPRADSSADAKIDALVELVGETPNLLLLGPVSCPADYDLCSSLIGAGGETLRNLLLVTYSESPDKRLDILNSHLRNLPDNVVVLSVGGSMRSSSESSVASHMSSGSTITIETIPDPTNIQRLGITISQYVSEWNSTNGDTLVCFHSLKPLNDALSDTHRVFRFFNTLFGRIRSANAYAHYHMDPAAHDQEVVSTFRPIFDEIVTFDEEGTLQVDHES